MEETEANGEQVDAIRSESSAVGGRSTDSRTILISSIKESEIQSSGTGQPSHSLSHCSTTTLSSIPSLSFTRLPLKFPSSLRTPTAHKSAMALEIVGAAAGCVALCTTLIRVCEGIHAAQKSVQHAREDIKQLANEGIIFANIYEAFRSTCNEELEKSMDTSRATRRLNRWVKALKKDLLQILGKVKTLSLDREVERKVVTVFKEHVNWFFKRSAVEKLRASLSVARESIQEFSIIVNIRKLNQLLDLLTSALNDQAEREKLELKLGMRLEEKIEVVKQAIETTNSAKDRLATAEQKSPTHETFLQTDMLSTFTDSVENCAKSVSPVAAARRRTQSSTSSETSRTASNSTQSTHPSTPTNPNNIPYNSVPRKPQPQAPRRDQPIILETRNPRPGSPPRPQTPVFRAQPAMPLANPTSTPSLRPWRWRTTTIGSHVILIFATVVWFNNYRFELADRSIAEAFYLALRKNKDRLDDLNAALGSYREGRHEWYEFPGWKIRLRQPEWHFGVGGRGWRLGNDDVAATVIPRA
ncbi:hypothetical protein J1614_008865 [Plenodomus biglobosus]|nr:hypothetical protein J1614_008865 [Plenodomus biglobosus]